MNKKEKYWKFIGNCFSALGFIWFIFGLFDFYETAFGFYSSGVVDGIIIFFIGRMLLMIHYKEGDQVV